MHTFMCVWHKLLAITYSYPAVTSCPSPSDDCTPHSVHLESRSTPNSLVGLYSFLSRLIKPLLSSGQPAAVIIDDLSVLLGQGVGLGEVVDFVHYCQVLMCHSSEGSMVSVRVCVHVCMRASMHVCCGL